MDDAVTVVELEMDATLVGILDPDAIIVPRVQ